MFSFLCRSKFQMIAALACIPLLSAFTGWFIIRMTGYLLFHPVKPWRLGSFTLQGVYYKKEKDLKAAITTLIKKELSHTDEITSLLGSPQNIEKLRPELEQHIDTFMKVKLKEAIPMIGMLIGDRTINQLKALFMQEMDTLFPSVMKSYVNHLKTDETIDRLIATRLDGFSAARVEKIIMDTSSHERKKLQWLGALFGLMIGCFQLLIIIYFIR